MTKKSTSEYLMLFSSPTKTTLSIPSQEGIKSHLEDNQDSQTPFRKKEEKENVNASTT